MFTDIGSLHDFLNLQRILKTNMSIEIGAFDADFSIAMKSIAGKRYAFEASRPIWEKYAVLMDGIEYINKAVSNYNGKISMYVDTRFDPSEVGHNSTKIPQNFNTFKSIEVECVSLDSYFNWVRKENIGLWIDCEGANKEVLTGGKELLKKVNSIYIEVEHKQHWKDIWLRQDIINYLDEQGFYLYKEYNANYQDQQSNCIFLRKN